MMSYGGIRFGLNPLRPHSMGDLASDAAAAAAGAATGASVVVPAGVVLARVTTGDPPPDGDLTIRTGPSDSSPQVDGAGVGGAEKDGIVAVLNLSASPDYSEVIWPGGARRGPARGFAHRRFLTILDTSNPAVAAGDAVAATATELSTGTKVALGLGAVAVVGLAVWALK